METFRDIGLLKTNMLTVVRHKWFFPWFELTDGQFCYGKLSYCGNYRRHAVIETAQGTYTVKKSGWLGRILNVYHNDDELTGTIIPEIWSRKITLKMTTGFEAELLKKKIFSSIFCWDSPQYGELVQIKLKPFNFKTPYTVIFDPNFQNNFRTEIPALPLLALLGINLILLRQAEAASAA